MNNNVLYVDDNTVMLDLIKLLLEKAGYVVLTANNATEGLEQAEGKSLGLIILDVNLAGESGLMLMNFMLHNHKGVPVILYSGGDHEQPAVEKMLKLGATEFVKKRSGAELLPVAKRLCPLS